jgi:hypothetical protein
MWAMASRLTTEDMDTTDTSPTPPQFAVAGSFLEALAAHDFDRLTDVLDADASMAALLPRGFDEWHGAAGVTAAFEQWFGGVDEFEVVDASVGQVGSRLQLRWRVKVRGGHRGDEPMIVEHHVYADTAPTGRIRAMSLLCSGFCREHVDG